MDYDPEFLAMADRFLKFLDANPDLRFKHGFDADPDTPEFEDVITGWHLFLAFQAGASLRQNLN